MPKRAAGAGLDRLLQYSRSNAKTRDCWTLSAESAHLIGLELGEEKHVSKAVPGDIFDQIVKKRPAPDFKKRFWRLPR